MNDDELEALAAEAEDDFVRRTRTMEDFRYDEQQGKYWDVTTGILLEGKSVDGAVRHDHWPTRIDGRTGEPRPVKPSLAINDVDTGLTVEGSTWWPGKPKIIQDLVVLEQGAVHTDGAACFNRYIPPRRTEKPRGFKPDPWIDHVRRLYPDPVEHEHFFDYCAHLIQHPEQKVNHGVVMAGAQGIGKDTALIPLRLGVGEWNTSEVGPDDIMGQYNPFVQSVLLVINEVRPHERDFKASNFYNMLKPYMASPPEVLPLKAKYQRLSYVRNVCRVVLTTNEPLSMYLPPEDRRLFVMTSRVEQGALDQKYFTELYRWLLRGGSAATVAWLAERDILQFNPGGIPPKTKGKQAIIDSADAVRRTLVDEVFELYVKEILGGNEPLVFFHTDLFSFVNVSPLFDDAQEALKQLKARNFHFKMAERGYDMLKNPYATEWRSGNFRSRTAFVHRSVPHDEQTKVVEAALLER